MKRHKILILLLVFLFFFCFSQVTLIGCIRNVNKQSTHHTFQIEDGTGTIDAKRFPSDDEDPAESSAVE